MPQRARDPMPAGLLYLVEHGHAADGSSGENAEPTQHLVNPPHHNPTSDPTVHDWMRRLARADGAMQRAKENG